MGKNLSVLLLLGFYLRICFSFSVNRSSIDESSLLSLKAHINSNTLAKNWSQDTSFCTWAGVTCSVRHPRVTGLNLSNMGLQGSISREIGNLSFLTFLDISNNNINSPIPNEIGNLRRLRVLDMAFNRLTDHIPESLSLCVKLRMFDMSYNNLTGNIPAGFGNLSQLQYFGLRSNQLTGELPSTIFNISSVEIILVGENQMSGSIPKDMCTHSSKLVGLGLFSNQLEGQIPSTIMHCRALVQLILHGNKFTGNIPSDFWNLTAIQRVGFARNQLTGTLPPSISNLSNLVAFDISDNTFHGTIPSEIGQLSSLTQLQLLRNKLTGEVPVSIFNLSSLQGISLGGNNLSGNLPVSIDKGLPVMERFILNNNHFHGKIPHSITNLSRLIVLELSSNFFVGDIPITLGNLHQLKYLNLAFNQLTNNLSKPEQDFLSSLKDCKYLKFVELSGNPITGVLPKSFAGNNLSASLEIILAHSCRFISPIPDEIGNLSSLLWLNLAYNDLTGSVPYTLGRLSNLQRLGISYNKFEGSISHVICNLKNLYSVNLEENNFFGEVPRCLRSLNLLREIDLNYNAFNSSIPSTFWLSERLERVLLSNNFLVGSLPQEVGDMKSLIELDLSGNLLLGDIPSTISQLQNLQHLDLSLNNFSGAIPKSLEKLASLDYFNVSFNQLSGEIPDKGPFMNFTPEYFIGNKGLCGAPRFQVETCKRNMPAPKMKKKLLKYVLPAVASVLLVVTVALILIWFLRVRSRKPLPSPLLDLPHGLMHERISYYEIINATNNLDDQRLIGRGSFGSVYRGNFSDGMVAAVKVFNLEVQGALKSFETECQIMRSVRHRNLVKVITSCSNLDFKAIVMEYMPKGNLENLLYSANSSLDIFLRLGIMIDVAYALEYLHEHFTFPIVHCDLKPNNVLLDEDMVAHVGDFGISKLLADEQRMQQTRTLGTIGYMAPEYGSEGIVSTMVDVYSYGILLMEVLSRKKPTDEMFSEAFTMKKWGSEAFPDLVMQMVDSELVDMDDESSRAKHEMCLTSTIELALDCTANIPEERPKMKNVLAKINKIKFNLHQ